MPLTSCKGKINKKEQLFIQMKNIWYYNVNILNKLKLSKLFIPTIIYITVTPYAEKVSMFTRQISDTWLGLP